MLTRPLSDHASGADRNDRRRAEFGRFFDDEVHLLTFGDRLRDDDARGAFRRRRRQQRFQHGVDGAAVDFQPGSERRARAVDDAQMPSPLRPRSTVTTLRASSAARPIRSPTARSPEMKNRSRGIAAKLPCGAPEYPPPRRNPLG